MAEDGGAGVSADILDSIDGALRDYELSADAMRWLPEEERKAPPALAPVFVPVTLDLEPFTRALEEAGRVLQRFFADVGAAVGKLAPLLAVMAGADAELQERRRGGGKLAVDGREYRRRQMARRRRGR